MFCLVARKTAQHLWQSVTGNYVKCLRQRNVNTHEPLNKKETRRVFQRQSRKQKRKVWTRKATVVLQWHFINWWQFLIGMTTLPFTSSKTKRYSNHENRKKSDTRKTTFTLVHTGNPTSRTGDVIKFYSSEASSHRMPKSDATICFSNLRTDVPETPTRLRWVHFTWVT